MGWGLGLLSRVTQETKIKEVEGKQRSSPEKIGSMGGRRLEGERGRGGGKHEGMRRKGKDQEGEKGKRYLD